MYTSGYRGVCWNKKSCKWQAALNNHGLYIYIGCFDSEADAAAAFDKAALRVRGVNTRLNFHSSKYMDATGQLLPDPEMDELVADAFARHKKTSKVNTNAEKRQYKRLRAHYSWLPSKAIESAPSVAPDADSSKDAQAAETLAGLRSDVARKNGVSFGLLQDAFSMGMNASAKASDRDQVVWAYRTNAAVPAFMMKGALSNSQHLTDSVNLSAKLSNSHQSSHALDQTALPDANISSGKNNPNSILGKRAFPEPHVWGYTAGALSAGSAPPGLQNIESMGCQGSHNGVICSVQCFCDHSNPVIRKYVQPCGMGAQALPGAVPSGPGASPDTHVDSAAMDLMREFANLAAAPQLQVRELQLSADRLHVRDSPDYTPSFEKSEFQSAHEHKELHSLQLNVRNSASSLTDSSNSMEGGVIHVGQGFAGGAAGDRPWQRVLDLDVAYHMFPDAPDAPPRPLMNTYTGSAAEHFGISGLVPSRSVPAVITRVQAHLLDIPAAGNFSNLCNDLRQPTNMMANAPLYRPARVNSQSGQKNAPIACDDSGRTVGGYGGESISGYAKPAMYKSVQPFLQYQAPNKNTSLLEAALQQPAMQAIPTTLPGMNAVNNAMRKFTQRSAYELSTSVMASEPVFEQQLVHTPQGAYLQVVQRIPIRM